MCAKPMKYKHSTSKPGQEDMIAKALKGGMFTDTVFPPDCSSLFRYPDKPWPGHIPPEMVEWRRVSEICDDPQLFIDGSEPGDCIQGKLGDCWFLGALSCLATHDKLLKNLFVSTKYAKQGMYTMKFFKNGKWKYVVFDDFVPCQPNGKPLYASSVNPNETWVMLAEKAYAKMHFAYENLISGEMTYALKDFTGGAPTIIKLPEVAPELVWQHLKRSQLMGCAATTTGKKEMEFAGGILRGHAYGVLNVKELNVGGNAYRFLHIRNPWGMKEWTGAWADNSPEWETPEGQQIGKQLGYAPGNDGAFWMTLDDFLKYYNKLACCRMFPESWQQYRFKGEWTKANSGGPPTTPAWLKNPQFNLTPKGKKTMVFLVLSQRDARMEDNDDNWNNYDAPIGFLVVKPSALKPKIKAADMTAKGLPFKSDREVSLQDAIQLDPKAGTVTVVPMTASAGLTGKFYLSIWASSEIDVQTDCHQEAEADDDDDDEDDDDDDDTFKPAPVPEIDVEPKAKLELDMAAAIEGCKKTGRKFEDPFFPADASSLFRDPNKPWQGHMPVENVQWLRPEEITGCKQPVLFLGGAEPGDVIQGALGDCWFLGALSCLSTKQAYLDHVFVHEESDDCQRYGVYTVQLYKNGKWKQVVVDDRIPCMPNGKPLYARCKDPNEIWVMILEKAYAKVHHCYENLISGTMTYGLKDLTGGAPQTIKFDASTEEKVKNGFFWKELQQFKAWDCLMGCAASTTGQKEMEFAGGILKGHAYGITDIKEVKGFQLLRIRNPWGQKEWTGDWSDASELWQQHPDVATACSWSSENDGTFWMTVQDFVKYYNTLYVTRVFNPPWVEQRLKSAWVGESAGGCCKYPTWIKNPQFQIYIKEKTELFVVINQKDARMNADAASFNKYENNLGYLIVTSEALKSGKTPKGPGLVGKGLPFRPEREVAMTSTITLSPKHSPYVIIPMTFEPNCEGSFILNIYSKPQCLVRGGEKVEGTAESADADVDNDDYEKASAEEAEEAEEAEDLDKSPEEPVPVAAPVSVSRPALTPSASPSSVKSQVDVAVLEKHALEAVEQAKQQLARAEKFLAYVQGLK